jgi:hypothetical protein
VESWNQDTTAGTLQELQNKLTNTARLLKGWERTTFGQVGRKLKKLKAELDRLQSDPQRPGPSYEELKIVGRMAELNYREELMWRQRSRIEWLKAGDRNTRFFQIRQAADGRKIEL